MTRRTLVLMMILTMSAAVFINGVHTPVAHAYANDCSVGAVTNIPQVTRQYYNGHQYYYAYLNGKDCDYYPSKGQDGCNNDFCWRVEGNTNATLSNCGTCGVYEVYAYVYGEDNCSNNGWVIDMQGGGATYYTKYDDTGAIPGTYQQNCSGHDYRIKSKHYLWVHSNDSAQGETGCDLPPYSQYYSC